MSNRFSIGTWDCKAGPQPPDYLLHEVLHAAVISVVRMDKRKPKEQRQAEEMLVQDLCRLIMPNGARVSGDAEARLRAAAATAEPALLGGAAPHGNAGGPAPHWADAQRPPSKDLSGGR